MRRFPALFILFALSQPAHAEAESPSFSELATCAVYFRMIVGGMRFARDLGPLAAMEEEKMDRAMELARARAVTEFGEAEAEREFQSAWRDNLAEMTDTINRNYDNVGQLKYRYDRQCEALVKF